LSQLVGLSTDAWKGACVTADESIRNVDSWHSDSDSDMQGCVRGQHFRGQDQWSSRPRPEVFEAKMKAKDLEARVEASNLCDEG